MSNSWCLIESDPAVFTELVDRFGVKGISVEELISLDETMLGQYKCVYGLIFLFKWKSSNEPPVTGTVVQDAPLYFAKQNVSNACATVALVNTLCNYGDAIDLGADMKNFLAFTQDLDPELRGSQLGMYEPLRDAHNSFAPPQAFDDDRAQGPEGDAYHFVSFLFRNGSIWEMDGLQSGPVLCADATPATYKAVLVDVVQKYIAEIAERDTSGKGQGISFSLMAVVDDPIVQLEAQIQRLRSEEKPVTSQQAELASLKEERTRGREENQRRRHNYNPMLIALLKALAEKEKLDGIVEDVKAKKGTKA